jgi:hypothetical protein
MRDIGGLAGGIDHDEHMIAPVGQHQVIQNTPRVVGEHAIALPHRTQPQQIHGHERLHRLGHGVIAPRRTQDHLTHVAHIEKPRLGAAMQMLLHHAHGILHRHVIAREGHHLGPQLAVQCIQRRYLQISRHPHPSLCSGPDRQSISPAPPMRHAHDRPRHDAPSVLLPEIAIPSASRSRPGSLQSFEDRAGPCA